MTLPNWITTLAATRADTNCPDCYGDGIIDVSYSDARQDALCPCVPLPLLETGGDPWADEGQSDAREMARDRW